jgi:hypothetical protein
MVNKTIKEIYISVDIESDGPIPGPYSMVSLGAVVAGHRTSDGEVVKLDVLAPENGFYAELKPISRQWKPEALAISGFSREYILENGDNPQIVMTNFAKWVTSAIETHGAKTAIFAAYPLGFDWMFTYWYLVNFSAMESPFGHSRHIDIKTLYSAKADEVISYSTKRNIPRFLHSKLPHTHNAKDDAAEQGQLLMNLLQWEGKTLNSPIATE